MARIAFMGERFGPLSRLGRVLQYIEKSAFISGLSTFEVRFFREITAPEIPNPLVFKVLETDCTTMSAPSARGRINAGVATVESTIIGMPCLCASSMILLKSKNACPGLLGISPYKNLVFPSISFSHSLMSCE